MLEIFDAMSGFNQVVLGTAGLIVVVGALYGLFLVVQRWREIVAEQRYQDLYGDAARRERQSRVRRMNQRSL